MIYVYCGRNSEAADALVATLGRAGSRLRNLANIRAESGVVVNWGTTTQAWPRGFTIVNPRVLGNKRLELTRFQQHRVPTLTVSDTYREGWFGRHLMHEDGNDLGADPHNADYWTQPLDIIDEFRVHSFQGTSLGVLKKTPRPGIRAHPTIRSYSHGWTFGYRFDRTLIPPDLRETAHRAVAALGYDFGAVDIGTVRGGGLAVFEVNSAPGIEGDELDAYAEALKTLHSGG